MPGSGGSSYSSTWGGVQRDPPIVVEQVYARDEVTVDVLPCGVEVAGVEQHRGSAVVGDLVGDEVNQRLRRVAFERDDRYPVP